MWLVLLFACSRSDITSLTVAGSSTIQPLMEVAAERFELAHPDVRVTVQGGGSGVGVSSVRSGLAQVGMVSRSLAEGEQDLSAHRIARDGIALIAHASRADASLTREQVIALYDGSSSTWPDGQPVTLVTKEEGRSTLELFAHHFGLEGRFRDDLVVIGPNGQAITTVASDPNALAYVSIGSAAKAEEAGVGIRRVPLDGVLPSVASVQDGSWPLARDLNLVTAGPLEGVQASLVGFVLSPEGQGLVVSEDFVPVADARP